MNNWQVNNPHTYSTCLSSSGAETHLPARPIVPPSSTTRRYNLDTASYGNKANYILPQVTT